MTRRVSATIDRFGPNSPPPTAEAILARLVSFPTISADSNLPLIDWVQEYLSAYGVTTQRFYDATGTKAALHGVIGPVDAGGGAVLSGHTDVVPVQGQAWQSDPFTLHADDDYLFGRGTCDMKGFLACMLARVPAMVVAPLRAPIHLAFSYDEEVGCLGVDDLAAAIAKSPVKPTLCVVGEPTLMKPITGHKGIVDLRCTVTGLEAHSSQTPYAVNAVEAAAELAVFVRSFARRMVDAGPYNAQFDPPFTTMQTSILHGGTAVNIVPNSCEIAFDLRPLPNVDVAALIEEIRQHAFRVIEPRMKDIDPRAGFHFRINAQVAAFDIAHDHPAVAAVQALSGSNDTAKVSFATEAGIFHHHGIPTVVCGPGSIDQAHKPDEFVTRSQLGLTEAFLDRLIERLSGVRP